MKSAGIQIDTKPNFPYVENWVLYIIDYLIHTSNTGKVSSASVLCNYQIDKSIKTECFKKQ
ncbi:MAG TPA: hypothetical protein DEO54_05885 [Rikenellaceae bacterium]|nr:MAG: hypothetical protein A2X20_07570 [Bacteroidetes bacterium GWE2_40_15]HBZ25758.1 hypothetical protein [Rikenellaceae bacterium]